MANDRPLGSLFGELSADLSNLLRQEMALARAEMRQRAAAAARSMAAVAAGAVLALVGALALVTSLVALLGSVLDGRYWLGALLVAVALLAVGGGLVLLAMRRIRARAMAPEATIESLRTTGSWAGQEVAELRAMLVPERSATEPRGGTPVRVRGDGVPTAAPIAGSRAAAVRTALAGRGGGEPDGAEGSGPAATRPTPAERPPAGRESGTAERPGLMKRFFREIREDDVVGQAAKVAYYAFLSLPPALMAIFAMTGIFGGQRAADWMTERLTTALPPEASRLVNEFVTQIVHENAPGPLSVGLLLAIWAASNVFMGLGDALNMAYDAEERRPWVKRRAMAIGVMVAFATLFLLASVSLLAGPQIAAAIGLWGVAEAAWAVLSWPVSFLFVVAAFWIVYYVLPNRDQSVSRKRLAGAAAVSALVWLLATAGFRFYISNFGNYSETYGILGTVIVLLLWMFMTGLVVIAGGELASEMEEDAA